MTERNSSSKKPTQSRPQEQDEPRGATDIDSSTGPTRDGGKQGTKNPDQGEVGLLNEATTPDGGIAVDGGKLPGNKDDFEGDMPSRDDRVPGAHGEGALHRPTNLESR